MLSDFVFINMITFNKRLLGYNPKIAIRITSKTKNCKRRFREKSIMKRNSVKSQFGKDKIIQTYRFDKFRSVIINLCLAAFGDWRSKYFGQNSLYIISPTAYFSCPLFDDCFLLRSKLALSFETSDISFNIWICLTFCSREQGRNNIC